MKHQGGVGRLLLALPVLLLGLTGCNESSCGKGTAGGKSSCSLGAPEKARFGSGAAQNFSPEAQKVIADARRAASRSEALGAAEPDARAYRSGMSRFDGARSQASEFTAPAVPTGSPTMTVRAGMAIDTDGAIRGYDARAHRDPHRQAQTSYRKPDGSYLNPVTDAYVVVPRKYKHMLGRTVEVEYKGRKARAIVGDVGPRFGEGSMALADRLGIPSHGVTGGVESGVTYQFH